MDPFTFTAIALGTAWLLKKGYGKKKSGRPTAYDMGEYACEQGQPLEDCPFPDGSTGERDWVEAWVTTYEGLNGHAALVAYMKKWGDPYYT